MDMHIPFHVLEQTTEGFSNKQMIGRGGYGKVYKGVYNEEEIAVKLFYDVPALDNKQFENEFFNLLRIEHPNVVRLVGYCYETQHKPVEYNVILRFSQYIYRILCFEFLQGGSLDKYLNESRDCDWVTFYNIIKGTCEGLQYLHGGCGSQILHLDLKPANILLDSNMEAKVADFGLSRFLGKTHTHITNTTIGTEDYMPPEFLSKKQISPKNDVYSLGVIIIDIMAGRRGYSEFREMDDATPFIGLVIMNWRERINATASPCPSAELDQVETCIKIAIKCVDPERKNRPTVAEILDILRETEIRFLESLPTPNKSAPRGGNGGTACDIKEKPWRLASLTINYEGLINAFSFSYIDQYGKKQRVGPWGQEYNNHKTETICFGPSEFVEEVSGAYGCHFENILVISLTFVTNIRTYGPFGNPYHQTMAATYFSFTADEGSSIVGFHGSSGSHLFSIGVYMILPIPSKSEPCGGSAGTARDINEKPCRLMSITISYLGLVDAFAFSYIDQAGKKQSVGPWGEGYHYDKIETIRFGPSESIEEVSVAYGSHFGNILVMSLTFVTNIRTYGPFGNPYHQNVAATHFMFMADEGSSIVGFHGRSGSHLFSIGVYMFPSDKTTTMALSVPILNGQSLPTPSKSGPWGGSIGTNRDINENPWRLTSITISYLGLVDAFSFCYIDQAGKKHSEGPWGEGYHHDKIEMIRFGPSEYVEEVSGAYGSHGENIIVTSLTFVTNVKTYGPFGNPHHQNVEATPFRFRADEDSSIAGFHGRSGRYLNAIGVYTVQIIEL